MILRNFISILIEFIKMCEIWWDLCWIELDSIYLIDFMRFGTYLISNLLLLWDFWIFLMFEYYIGMQSFYKCHQISFLCDHQELACTPKDPPRRVDMNERSLISFYNQNCWVIDKNVWKPALLDLLENRIWALIS